MSGIKDDARYFQTIGPLDPDIPMISPRDQELMVQTQQNQVMSPVLYQQAFSPEYPAVWSVNDHQFQPTSNAQVKERDDLKGQYSPAPELPKNQTDYSKILFFMVAGFLIYKFIKKRI